MRIKESTESIYVEVLLYLDCTTHYTTTEYVDFDKTRVLHNISLLKFIHHWCCFHVKESITIVHSTQTMTNFTNK